MINAKLFSFLADGEIFSGRLFNKFPRVRAKSVILPTTDYVGAFSKFTSATRTGAGTTTLVTPEGGGSIILTDLIVSGERQVASTSEVRFTDGTDTVTIFIASAVDAPPTINHSFRARVQGWKDARLDLVTTGTADATVFIGYTKMPDGLSFEEWDALR